MPCKFDSDPDRVFDEAYGVRLNYKKMKKLEKEYTTMKVKEKEDEIELRVSGWQELPDFLCKFGLKSCEKAAFLLFTIQGCQKKCGLGCMNSP